MSRSIFVALIGVVLAAGALACGDEAEGPAPESGGAEALRGQVAPALTCSPDGCLPWPTPPVVEEQAAPVEADTYCANDQCFDGGDPQPGGGTWASQWTWDQCMSGCMGCSAWCKPHCTARCGP